MKIDLVYRFPISYFIKKSFPVDNAQMLPSTKSTPSKELENSPSSSKSIQSPGSQNTSPLGQYYAFRLPICNYGHRQKHK